MKTILVWVLFWILDSKFWILLFLTFCTSSAWATPTLARLSFRVPPARMTEFETAYREKVVPILKKHGLVESSERGRATPDSVFSRLFEVKTPTEVEEKQKVLQDDSTWEEALRGLGTAFERAGPDGLMQHGFMLYAMPVGPGKVVPAGPGKVVSAGRGTGYWRTYDVADGLIQAIVQAIFQDRQGNLWFGTRGGVSRYDGKSFTAFTTQNGLVDNRVNSIFQDREGNLWFGTWGGVSRYDGRAFTNFTTREGLPNNWVWSVFQDREGYLWFGSNGGASRYDGSSPSTSSGQRFTTFTTRDGLAHNQVQAIFQDREGNLWFGTYGGGVSRYDGKSWIALTTRDGLPNDRVHSILQDREGHLWFGTEGGVSRYDGKTFSVFTSKDGLASDAVFSIRQDGEGILWFGTVKGLSRYDGKSFTTQETLPDNTVWSLFEDREGHLWVGTWGGVSRYDGKTFTSFTTEDGLASNVVSSMFQDREGHLWVGTWGGVSRYDRKAFTNFAAGDGFPDNSVKTIFQDRDGHFWFGTEGSGVSRYDGKNWTTFTTKDGLTHNNVRSIFQDREEHLWFGTVGGGVSRYDREGRRSGESSEGGTFTTFNTFDGLPSDVVLSIFQDREDKLWFGTEGGASRYDDEAFTNFTTKDGLVSNRVYSISQDREGGLWFGTWGSGVSRYDGKVFTNFTAKDGLTDDWVSSIFQDREGHLWFGTSGGVSRYDGRTFQTVLQKDGLTSNSVGVILQDREGNLWFSTTKGVTRYRPPSPSPPPVFIDAVIADRRYEKVSDLATPSSVKLTAFEFHGISLKTRPGGLIYRYRLNGYDKDWKNTNARRVEYQDLSRGTYTFEVQAVDRDLVYSERLATVTLRVHLPYERIGWMSALGIALALVAWQTARVIRWDVLLRASNAALVVANKELFVLNQQLQEKTKRLQEVDAVKTDFFSNVSHELRTPMTAIKGYVDNLLDGIAGALNERQARYLMRARANADRLTRLINDLLDLSRIDRGQTDLLQLNIQRAPVREAVAEAVEGLLPVAEGAGLRLTFEGEEAYGLADRDRLMQIVTNLVGNAIKFTPRGGEVEVRVSVDRGSWIGPPSYPPVNGGKIAPSPSTEGRGRDLMGATGGAEDGVGDGSRITNYGFVVVCVRDTGRGIPPEDLEKVFDRFYQVKGEGGGQPGTGLGLPITKELVELMGGTIHVESEVGKGSTFWFTLPEAKT